MAITNPPPALAPVFRAAAGLDEAPEHLEETLRSLIDRGANRWPGVGLDEKSFVEWLGARALGRDPVASLGNLHTDELYLACAATVGDRIALSHLEGAYFARLDAAIRRVVSDASAIEDVKQRLRQALLVPSDTAPPRISTYGGRGDLLAWLRVSAVREALKTKRGDRLLAVEDADDAIFAGPLSSGDPELEAIAAHHRPDFKAALTEAFRALSQDDQDLLRAHYVDGFTIDDLSARRGVHRATVARWIERARGHVEQGLRRALAARFRLSRQSCDSLVLGLMDGMDLTLSAWRAPAAR